LVVTETENILISVEDRHARNMLIGSKTVELRRRSLRISPGTRVWIYAKLPKAHVGLVAIVDKIEAARPKKLWDRYQAQLAVSHREFVEYFDGVVVGYAIVFRGIWPLQPSIRLDELRKISRAFQPPQFFKRLNKNCPELRFFTAAWLGHASTVECRLSSTTPSLLSTPLRAGLRVTRHDESEEKRGFSLWSK
jgi:predicted transcriptional regulator